MAGATSLGDKARGLGTRNEVVRMWLIDEGDFLTTISEWPAAADINGSFLITALMNLVLSSGTHALGLPVFRFAIQTGKAASKKNAGKGLGYENYSHDGLVGEFVGLTTTQWGAVHKLSNKGVIAIVENGDGSRRVYGSKMVPLQAIFADESSAEGTTLKAEFKPTGVHTFMPPFLDPALTIPVGP